MFDFIGVEGEAFGDTAFEHLNSYVIDAVHEANEKITGRPLTDKHNVVPMFLADDDYTRLVSQGRSGARQTLADTYGHLKRRDGSSRPLAIPERMDGIDMLMTHANRMHRFASYVPEARNAELLLNDPELKRAIIENNGEQGYDSIVDAVHSETAGYAPADAISRKLAKWNHTAADAMIGAKLSVMANLLCDTGDSGCPRLPTPSR